MADYRTRLKKYIELTSPQGQSFQAYWIGDSPTKSKSLGRFKMPRINGEIIQDMDFGAEQRQMSIYFEGKDNDKIAKKFWKACDQTGLWKIKHPVEGTLKRQQLSSVTWSDQPVTSGNIAEFSLEFITALDILLLLFTQAADALTDIKALAVSAGLIRSTLMNTIRTTTAETTAISGTASSSLESISSLSAIYGSNAETANEINTLTTQITNILSNDTPNYETLFTYMNTIFATTMSGNTNGGTLVSSAESFVDAIFLQSPIAEQTAGINTCYMQELVLMSMFQGFCTNLIRCDIISQSQAISYALSLCSLFKYVVNILDQYQSLYESNGIDKQYFSNLETLRDIAAMVCGAVKYLYSQSFNLAREKKFTLKQDVPAIVLFLEEYESQGDNDENYNLFLTSNNIDYKPMLRAGREIVTYRRVI